MRYARPILCLFALTVATIGGCIRGPSFVSVSQRKPIDRSVVDYPSGVVMEEVVRSLTGAIDCEMDTQGNLIVAEAGAAGYEPHIFGYHPDGSRFDIYPPPRFVRVPFDAVIVGYQIYGPVGGIAVENNKVYVTHRDSHGMGAITAFGYDGSHSTVTSNIPCQGDNGMSDVAIGPNGRLWFGVGSATNSGVVGLDNWPWIKKYPEFADRSFFDLKLLGFHFKSKNPESGLFGAPEIAVTAPYQPFNVSTQTRIQRNDFPTAAIYSVNAGGGGLRVEAHGVHCPRGVAFSELGTPYMTNGGMELRGTRPVKDDPDGFLKIVSGTWYGFPDYSTDLEPITSERFQPRGEMFKLLIKSGYDEIGFLIDHNASNNGEGLIPPVRGTLLQSTFPSLSGASRFDFVPATGPFHELRGNAIVPLSGDRAPFATSGEKLAGPVGFKIVRVEPGSRDVVDFIRNARGGPASGLKDGEGLLERPVAVKFAPNGDLYIVDFGKIEYKDGKSKLKPMSGRIFRVRPVPTSQPATTMPAK